MKVVFIEGPGKKESVEKYLGAGYKVIPTMGHVRDLPEKGFGVEINNNFKPDYVIMPDKKKVVEKLVSEAKKAEQVLLATDPDREGILAKFLGLMTKINAELFLMKLVKMPFKRGLASQEQLTLTLLMPSRHAGF